MTPENTKTTDEAEIREMIERRVKAVRDKNLDVLLSDHAPGVLSFDALDPLQYAGLEAVRSRAQEWFSSYRSAIGYEVRDLEVTADGAVAFCRFLYHVTGTLNDGGEVDMWVRATVCLNKTGGAWKVVHEHQSVPFDAKTGKASLNLRP